MKKPATAIILAALLLTATACSPPPPAYSPPTSETNASQNAEEDLRAYYEALIADLRQELSNQKQENYVARREYESRIADLEARLEAAEQIPDDTDIPVSAPVESEPVESTSPPPGATSFHYIIENGKAIICSYTGQAQNVVIPREIVGYPVGSIGDNAFQGSPVTSVLVPDTVNEIGWFAFADCPSLTSVTLPASVTSIGYGAFDSCPHLTILCPRNSYAATYALSFALRVKYV